MNDKNNNKSSEFAVLLKIVPVASLFKLFKESGYGLRIVGGALRNILSGYSIKDIDFATDALPDQMMELLKKSDFKAIPTGIEHGTITAVHQETMASFEITTLRKDLETDGRHATVEFTDDWEEDASRRDFTFNALYLDQNGTLYDYFGGVSDLEEGKIRFIGDAEARIQEDYLRVLRFFRFYAKFVKQDNAHDEEFKLCAKHAEGLKKISRERIGEEFLKILVRDYASQAISMMVESDIGKYITGEVALNAELLKSLAAYETLYNPSNELDSTVRRLWAVFYQGDKETDYSAIQDDLRLSNSVVSKLEQIDRSFKMMEEGYQNTTVAYFCGKEATIDAILLHAALNNKSESQTAREVIDIKQWNIPKFPLTGGDLVSAGFSGEDVGNLKRELEHMWCQSDYSLEREGLLKVVNEKKLAKQPV